MSLTHDDYALLLKVLDLTAPEEIDCTELVDRVAGFIERLCRDGERPRGYEAVVQHLQLCPECLELFDALYRVTCDREPRRPG